MTARELPGDGAFVWRVTSTAGTRLLRLRKGGLPEPVPADARAVAVSTLEADDFAAQAPAEAAGLWRLTEASQPRWGWVLWQLPPAGRPDGWTLAITDPAGHVQRYTWVRRGDEYMPTVAWEQRRRARDQLTGL